MLSFPSVQHLVIAAFRLDDFIGMRILVDLDGALTALALLSRLWSARATWIKDVDYFL
ncbi:hypothetical protein D3C80_2098290 [compost metagenome]